MFGTSITSLCLFIILTYYTSQLSNRLIYLRIALELFFLSSLILFHFQQLQQIPSYLPLNVSVPARESSYAPSAHNAAPNAIDRMHVIPAAALTPTTPPSENSAFAQSASFSSIGFNKPDAPPQRPRGLLPTQSQSQSQSQAAFRALPRAPFASPPRRPTPLLPTPESPGRGGGGATARGGPKSSAFARIFSDKTKRMMVCAYSTTHSRS